MKTKFLQATACACVAFALSTVVTRADEPKKDVDSTTTTTKTRHKPVASTTHGTTKTTVSKTATTAIPTRDGRGAKYSPGGIVGGSDGHEHAVLTGSNIPRDYDRRGYTTNSRDGAFIYDKNDIRLRSTNNVQDSLRSVPGVSVGGLR